MSKSRTRSSATAASIPHPNLHRRPTHPHAIPYIHRHVHPQHTRTAEIMPLVNGEPAVVGQLVLPRQIRTQRRGGSASGRILHHAAGWERIARVQRVRVFAPDQIDRGPVARCHQRSERIEVVVQIGQTRAW